MGSKSFWSLRPATSITMPSGIDPQGIEASFRGGPGVIFLFIFAAIACGFAALCYAEFASKIPIAGSAYTNASTSWSWSRKPNAPLLW